MLQTSSVARWQEQRRGPDAWVVISCSWPLGMLWGHLGWQTPAHWRGNFSAECILGIVLTSCVTSPLGQAACKWHYLLSGIRAHSFSLSHPQGDIKIKLR